MLFIQPSVQSVCKYKQRNELCHFPIGLCSEICEAIQGLPVISTLLYYFYFRLLLLHYIPKENIVLFTPYIFPDNQKYSLHFECLAGQEHSELCSEICEDSHGRQ
jgi:hypothetical protein